MATIIHDRALKTGGATSHEFWWHALSVEVDSVWGQIPWIDDGEMKAVAQSLAATAYVDATPDCLQHRKEIQEAYMSGVFSEKTIEKYRRIQSYGSNLQKVLRNVCTLYNRTPERKFLAPQNGNDGTDTDALFHGAYSEMKANVAFQRAYKIAFVTNHVALRPRFSSGGKWKTELRFPHSYRLRPKEDFPDEVGEMWVANYSRPTMVDGRVSRVVRFTVWTDEFVWSADYRGRPIGPDGKPVADVTAVREVNPYGRIPYTFIRLNDPVDGDLYGSGMWDLVSLQVWNNVTRFINDRNHLFTSYAILIAINMGLKGGSQSLAPGSILNVDDVRATQGLPGEKVEPDIRSVGQESSFNSGEDFRHERIREFFREHGLPSYYYDESGNPPSGEALKVQERELRRITDEHRPSLGDAERDFAELTGVVNNVDRWRRTPGGELVRTPLQGRKSWPVDLPDFSIDWQEEPFYISPKEDYALAKEKMEDGVLSPREFLKRFGGHDSVASDAEAIEIMKRQSYSFGGSLTSEEPPPSNNIEGPNEPGEEPDDAPDVEEEPE